MRSTNSAKAAVAGRAAAVAGREVAVAGRVAAVAGRAAAATGRAAAATGRAAAATGRVHLLHPSILLLVHLLHLSILSLVQELTRLQQWATLILSKIMVPKKISAVTMESVSLAQSPL